MEQRIEPACAWNRRDSPPPLRPICMMPSYRIDVGKRSRAGRGELRRMRHARRKPPRGDRSECGPSEGLALLEKAYRVTVRRVPLDGAEPFVDKVRNDLRGGTFRPMPSARAHREGGQPGKFRPLGFPIVKDRVVQAAVSSEKRESLGTSVRYARVAGWSRRWTPASTPPSPSRRPARRPGSGRGRGHWFDL